MGFQQEYQLGPIASDNYMTEYFRAIGYEADGITLEFTWYGQKIVEWNENHEVVWSWKVEERPLFLKITSFRTLVSKG